MKVFISNRQKTIRPNLAGIRRLTVFLMDQGRRSDARRSWDELSLVLMDDEGMERINRVFLDRTGTTDVISFAWPPGSGRGGTCGGELFLNVQRAAEEGRSRGGIVRELALYIAHGCDHLRGESDRSARGRRRMRVRELRWLRRAAGQRLLSAILDPQ